MKLHWLLLCVTALNTAAHGDLTTPTIEPLEQPLSELLMGYGQQDRVTAPPSDAEQAPGSEDAAPHVINPAFGEAVKQAYEDHVIRRLQRQDAMLQEHAAAISWNRRVSTVVTWTVHLLVLAGLLTSWLEFWMALRLRVRGKGSSTSTAIELELSYQRMAVKTSLIGFSILALSLAFYSLFLLMVHPVTILGE